MDEVAEEEEAAAATADAEGAARPSAKVGDNKRLWWTEQGRERWQKAVRGECTSAALAVAIHALVVHCAAFDVLVAAEAKPGAVWAKTKRNLSFEIESFYHADAFVEVRGRKGVRAATARVASVAIR
jgi:hypothetical protein